MIGHRPPPMIIDVHGHYTTAPRQLAAWRQRQIASAGVPFTEPLVITDDEIRETIAHGQLRLQTERGTDLTLFSPTAGGMAHHYGDEETSRQWTTTVNDLIHRVCGLFPDNFVGVCQLPQSPGVSPANCIAELERCVEEYGFVGCNLNPDPSDGYWTGPPLTDKWWYPLYERMVELDVPGDDPRQHVVQPQLSRHRSPLPQRRHHRVHAIDPGGSVQGFPSLKFVIPHGGGAVPYHWGRYRGIAQDAERPPIEGLLDNVFFDTCVYHYPGVRLLVEVIGADNVVFASEMIGAVKGVDARSGHFFDDTKRYVDAIDGLSHTDRHKIYEGNALKIYPRLARKLAVP